MSYNLVVRGGSVVDGSGAPRVGPVDVGVTGDRITAIGDLSSQTAERVIDAAGKIVAPGFIDVHIHSEIELLGGPHRYASLLQGVTTQLLTPDGFGWAPLTPQQAAELWEATVAIYGPLELDPNWPTPQAFLAIFDGHTPANVFPQVPHTALRYRVMGWEPRPATNEELEQLRGLTRQWMEAGATCLCLGLDYQPSAFADTRELIELSKVAREYDGIYTAHIRYNEIGRTAAFRETMRIGQEADIPVHISHEFVTDETEPLYEEARQICDMTFESYMYPAGCTHLLNMLPIPLQGGGPPAIKARLQDQDARAAMRAALKTRLEQDRTAGARPVFANTHTGRYIGLSIFEAADQEGLDVADFAMRVFDEEYPEGLMVYRRLATEDDERELVRRTLRHPMMMVASDGIYNGPHAHPRGYGCFARTLGLGVRELGAVSLEEAVRKMSGFPAERFRIKERGLLREGYGADLVIFDEANVGARSTWDEPRLHPVGIEHVIVNGEEVVSGGQPTGALPGRVLV
jgi:N-acyl-D-amino-acid deacylase